MSNIKPYIINSNTIAILPEGDNYHLTAKIIEINKIIYSNDSPIKVVKNSLLHYGNTLNGAKDSSIYHLGRGRRLPIMINREKNIYFFTSMSSKSVNNIWLSVDHTKKISKVSQFLTRVTFSNNIQIAINLSYTTIYNSYLRGIHLKKSLDSAAKESSNSSSELTTYSLPLHEEKIIIREKNSLSYIMTSSLNTNDDS